MKSLRLLFLLGCAALLVSALSFEKHEIGSLTEKGVKAESRKETITVSGLGFTEAATVDGFLVDEGMLYDIYSLKPLSGQTSAKLGVEKKCPT